MADQFVDLIGFHELGHTLTYNYGVEPPNLWLGEFLATYWAYAFIAERQPEWKRVFDLLGRPSAVLPQNTSLEDFEHLYVGVDDYGWYQGMFEARVREIYPELRLRFLNDLRREFPKMQPPQVVMRLEKLAPGSQRWAAGFCPTLRPSVSERK